MGRRVDSDDLVGTKEIGERLGVGYRSVHTWLRRYPEFPPAIATVSGVSVWDWPDIERWAKATGRL
jgi:hypothetical protein